ncbi:MAG: endonuclease III [Chloroherpetonaceae bacterium]|nr:endonuclease III [Chloroherpetonaceae bacterium]
MGLSLAQIATRLEKIYGVPRRVKQEAQGAVPFQPDLLDELVGTILSQNTSDANSSRAFQSLKKTFPTWRDVLKAPTRKLANAIKVGGLSNVKAKRIKAILSELFVKTGALSLAHLDAMTTEDAMTYLRRFKGVGFKTAACVMMFGLGRDICPVDTHIHRILNRLGLMKTKNADETFRQLQPLLPKGKAYSLHVNLIRHGKRVCKAQKPNCLACVFADDCAFAQRFR